MTDLSLRKYMEKKRASPNHGVRWCVPSLSTISLRSLLNMERYLYASVSSTQIRPSEVFCGNEVKELRGGVCRPKAPKGKAQEKVEVRGWVFRIKEGGAGWTDGNEEYAFDLLLDYGWMPETKDVYPINSIEAINSAITPHNVILFGFSFPPSSPLFDPYWQGPQMSSMLDTDGKVWGGPEAMVVHVEVNGWSADGRMKGNQVPSDWMAMEATPGVYWPFDPSNPPSEKSIPLREGDYVRLVGTLWEDEPHIYPWNPFRSNYGDNRGGEIGNTAKADWDEGSTKGRGWFEIHPVDFMARIDDPGILYHFQDNISSALRSAFEIITIIGETKFIRDIRPPGKPLFQDSTVGFEEFIDGDFTVYPSIGIGTDAVGSHEVIKMDDMIQVRVSTKKGSFWGHGAKFKAAYRVFWIDPR